VSQKSSDYCSLPLCSECHTQAPHAYRHIGRKAFGLRHETDLRAIAAELHAFWAETARESATVSLSPGASPQVVEP
jgi:hypothetical protein